MNATQRLLPVLLSTALVAAFGTATASATEGKCANLTDLQCLGKLIFFDEDLSLNRNQACATCHVPSFGWQGNDPKINRAGAVYPGSDPTKFGNRKPPSSAYASPAPPLFPNPEDPLDPTFTGGTFWDGRATGWELGSPVAEQARGPFLNPVEQALPHNGCVVYRVCTSGYADLFTQLWEAESCQFNWPADIETQCSVADGTLNFGGAQQKVDRVYNRVAASIAAYEDSSESNAYTSKIDAHHAGDYEFTAEEAWGRDLFAGRTSELNPDGKDAGCAACHRGAFIGAAIPPLFTDFTYDNLGVPKNPENPATLADPTWADPGLGGFLAKVEFFAEFADQNLGKQKVPTLRNVALKTDKRGHRVCSDEAGLTKAYMHNGYFKSLKQVVHFYNTRDVKPTCDDDLTAAEAMEQDCWPAPEVAENVNTEELGNLGLTDAEEDALVTFMESMCDGYTGSADHDDFDRPRKKHKDD